MKFCPTEFTQHMGASFDDLYKSHNINLVKYITRKCTRDVEESNDIASAAWNKVLLKYKTYNSDYSFATWLYRIAYNEFIDPRRSNNRINTISMNTIKRYTDDDDELDEGFIDRKGLLQDNLLTSDTYTNLDTIINDKRCEILRKCIDEKLPDNIKKTIYMWIYQGYKQTEISEILDLNISTVKLRVMEGKRMIKKELYGIYYDLMDEIELEYNLN